MSKHFFSRTSFLIPLTMFVYVASCRPPKETVQIPSQPIAAKKLTVFLLDRSGSFHQVQKDGHFKDQDYFQIACNQVKHYAENKADKHNELILVKAIQSASFSDETFIAKLDYTQNASFGEPEPKGAYSKIEKEQWAERKEKYEKDIKDRQESDVKTFSENLDQFSRTESSGETDIVNAVKALVPQLIGYLGYSKRVVIYSDFKDTQTELEAAEEIDLGSDTQVEGLFVSMNDQNPETYDRLIKHWLRILKCGSIKFKTPAESI